MTEDDLHDVLEIEQTTKAPWSAHLFASELKLAHGWQFVFKNKESSQLSGFIIGNLIADEAEILKLAVAPDYRRMHIATKLVRKALFFLQEKKAANCFLELRKSNKTALALYKKHGFDIIGERKGYYKNPNEDAFLMKKNLKTGTILEKH